MREMTALMARRRRFYQAVAGRRGSLVPGLRRLWELRGVDAGPCPWCLLTGLVGVHGAPGAVGRADLGAVCTIGATVIVSRQFRDERIA